MRALLACLLLLAPVRAFADACPAAITDAAKKAVPGATVTSCKSEGAAFEVHLAKTDKSKIEVEVAADGKILEIEEVVPLASVPAPVTKAASARYPKSTAKKAEKQTKADKSVTYEITVQTASGLKEATFTPDGTFVEEE